MEIRKLPVFSFFLIQISKKIEFFWNIGLQSLAISEVRGSCLVCQVLACTQCVPSVFLMCCKASFGPGTLGLVSTLLYYTLLHYFGHRARKWTGERTG